jgi:hypothetical protein
MPVIMFYAEYRGSFLPEESWKGSIQSSYSKVLNLLHPSGYLISIVDSINNMSDFGVVIPNFSYLVSELSNGSFFSWEGSQIIFSDIIVDITRASEWSGALPRGSFKNLPDSTPLKSTFNNFATDEGLSPVFTNKAGNIYSNAAGNIIEMAVIDENISKGTLLDLSLLVGLGIGFTPSGDDFLTGVMLWETISGIAIMNRETIKSNLSGTTEGGRTLLILALRNSFPFYLKQFAESFFSGKFSTEDVVKRVLKHGSTSGSDALTGFLWASEKIEKK